MTVCQNEYRNFGVVGPLAVLVAVVGVVLCLTLPMAWHWSGDSGALAALVAAGACMAGAVCALLFSRLLQGPQLAMPALLLGMTARMGIPLALGLGLHLRGGPLVEAGLLYYLLVFYPIVLAVETYLSLPPVRRSTPAATETAHNGRSSP